MTPLLFVLLGCTLLYGLTYLLVESDLLEQLREWFTSVVEFPADAKIAALDPSTDLVEGSAAEVPSQAPENVAKPKAGKIRIFVGRILSCESCTSGWLAIPSAGLVVCLALAFQYNIWWLVALLSVLIAPPTGVGFTVLIDCMSPKRASDRIVDAGVDVAASVLAASGGTETVLPKASKKV